jgi:hypothetical protein
MRSLWLLVLVCASCRTQPYAFPVSDDGGSPPQPTLDFTTLHDAGPGPILLDLAQPGPDLARPVDLAGGGTGCAALAQCLAQCNDQTCSSSCQSQASPAANMQLDGILNCALKHCESNGVMPSCQGPNDQSDTCGTCLSDVMAPIFGGGCTDQSPDCNTTDCALEIKMCLAG